MNSISPLSITTHLYAVELEHELKNRRHQAQAHGYIHEDDLIHAARSRPSLFTWPVLRRRKSERAHQSEHERQKSPRFSGAA